MSTELPARPNLEQYKKQAKDRLKQIRADNPNTTLTLSEVQFAIAREHGFDSWPKFAKHIGPHPLAGEWIADVARSKRHPHNQFRRAMLQFDVKGESVTVTNAVIEESGRVERGTHTVVADGHERETGNGHVLRARWIGTRVLETVASKEGVVVGKGRYEVSPDGATLTVTDGTGDQRLVFERRSRLE